METLLAHEGNFGCTLELFWGYSWVYGGDFGRRKDHLGIIVGSFWVYKGVFAKNIHFQIDFNDSYITLGSRWGRFWCIKMILGSFWRHFWCARMTLELLWGHFETFSVCEGDFGITLVSLWVAFGI